MSDSMASRTKSSSSMTEILIVFDNSKGPNGKRRLVKTLRNPGLVLIRQKFDFQSHRATLVAAALGSLKCPLWVKSRHRSATGACPLYPQKRTWISTTVMSALCQKQTFNDRLRGQF